MCRSNYHAPIIDLNSWKITQGLGLPLEANYHNTGHWLSAQIIDIDMGDNNDSIYSKNGGSGNKKGNQRNHHHRYHHQQQHNQNHYRHKIHTISDISINIIYKNNANYGEVELNARIDQIRIVPEVFQNIITMPIEVNYQSTNE